MKRVEWAEMREKLKGVLEIEYRDKNSLFGEEELAPWIQRDNKRGISDVVRPVISNNQVHDKFQDVKRLLILMYWVLKLCQIFAIWNCLLKILKRQRFSFFLLQNYKTCL